MGDQPADGGATTDPACPRNLELLESLRTGTPGGPDAGARACQYNDICPYGSSCNQQTGLCAYDCTADSDCNSTDGGTLVCDCLGHCVAPGGTPAAKPTNAPILTVDPSLIEMPLASVVVTGDPLPVTPTFSGARTITATLTSPITVPLGDGGVGGPAITINVSAGKYLAVQCPSGSGYTTAAKTCDLTIASGEWTATADGVAITKKVLIGPSTETPVSGEKSLGTWSVDFRSSQIAAPKTVSFVYNHRVANTPVAGWTNLFTSPPASWPHAFNGELEVSFLDDNASSTLPLSVSSLTVPVIAIARGQTLRLFDSSGFISASGVVELNLDQTAPDISYIDTYHEAEIPKSVALDFIRASVTPLELKQDPASLHLEGSFRVDAHGINAGVLSSLSLSARFVLTPINSMVSCDPLDTTLVQVECPSNTGCVSGFCTNPVILPEVDTFASDQREGAWLGPDRINYLNGVVVDRAGDRLWPLCAEDQSAAMDFYFPGGGVPLELGFENSDLTAGGFLKFSGESPCVTENAGTGAGSGVAGPRAIPLLTNKDDSLQRDAWYPNDADKNKMIELGSSALLGKCLEELQAESPSVSPFAATNFEKLGSGFFEPWIGARSCVSLGNFFGALELLRSAPSNDQDDIFWSLLRQWLEMHTFIATQSTEEHLLDDVLTSEVSTDQTGAPMPTKNDVRYENVLDVVGDGLWFAVKEAAAHVPSNGVLLNPDYRGGGSLVPSTETDPQYEQPYGAVPALAETTAAYLRVLATFMNEEALKNFESSGGVESDEYRLAVRRFGYSMRTALFAQNLAINLHGRAARLCTGSCTLSWEGRWQSALLLMHQAMNEAFVAGRQLSMGLNPLGIGDDDLPIYFGDPVGTSSRYFASSDYLLQQWAIPAVTSAQTWLDTARAAWVQQRDAARQDELSANDRARRLEQIGEQFGRPIIDACGLTSVSGNVVDGTKAIDLITSRTVTPGNCYVDPSCPGAENAWNADATLKDIAAHLDDQTLKYQMCIYGAVRVASNALSIKQASVSPSTNGSTDISVQQGVLYQPDVALCLASNPGTATVYMVGEQPFVRGTCNGESASIRLDAFLGISNLPGATVTDLFDSARQKCDDQYGFKPLPLPTYSPSCLHGNLGVNVAKGTAAVAAVTEALANLQVSQSQLAGKQEECLALTNDFTKRDEMRANLDVIRQTWIQTEFNAAVTADETKVGKFLADLVGGDGGGLLGDLSDLVGLGEPLIAKGIDYACKKGAQPYCQVESTGKYILGNAANYLSNTNANDPNDLHQTMAATQSQATEDHDRFVKAEAAYNDFVASQDESQAVGKCWSEFQTQKAAIEAGVAQVDTKAQDVATAAVAIGDSQRVVIDQAMAGAAALAREKDRKWDGYAFHYWLDEKVARYKRELEWARRLTYLSMRAVEFEFQESLPLRTAILTAHSPDDLDRIQHVLLQEEASRSINRRRPEESSVVLSIRDDVFKVADRTDAPAGERNWTPAQRFEGRMRSPNYTVYDKSGNALGQGVRFNLDPTVGGAANGISLDSRCGERLWRVTATIQGDGLSSDEPGAPVLLLKKNTFAAQWCASHGDGSAMQVASIQPSRQLFSSDDLSTPVDEANDYVSASVYPWFNIRKTDFYKTSYQDGDSEELAGRSLYGDYILLFPKKLIDAGFPLEKVEDVLVRFDYLSVDNLAQVSN
ncbi:MAG TPA: hypothetical protein VHJ20_24795 [Polyangia bacterium]|nr:hypothetical protein [Polyangia bacterium]